MSQTLSPDFSAEAPQGSTGYPLEVDIDKQIIEKTFNYLAEGKDDSEIEALLANDFDPAGLGFKDLIKQAHLKIADELEKAYAEEDSSAQYAMRATDQVMKIWLENYCLRNRKKMITDPAEIARYYQYLKAKEEAEERAEQAILRLEDDALPEFPRLSGSLSDLADALYPDIPYGFKMMGAATHFGLIRSGLDKLQSDPYLQPRFYTCFIALPWRGKTAAINEIRKHMAMVKPQSMSVMSSVDSGPALVDEFEGITHILPPIAPDQAARVLLDPDELRDIFEKSKVSAQSRNSLSNEFLKLLESNRTGNRTRKNGKKQIDNAHFAILGGATPEGYKAMWTGTGGAASGLQSRFVLVTTDAPAMKTLKQPSDQQAAAAAILRITKQAGLPGQNIRLDDEAGAMLADWADAHRDKNSEARVSDFVKRLLIVLAVTNDTTIVGKDLVTQGIRFGEYVIAVREKFNAEDSYSWTQAFENEIMAVAKKHSEPMTMNQFRQLVHPERHGGGFGSFLQAWKNLVATGALLQDGTTSKNTPKYKPA